jgi:hypothetical protein
VVIDPAPAAAKPAWHHVGIEIEAGVHAGIDRQAHVGAHALHDPGHLGQQAAAVIGKFGGEFLGALGRGKHDEHAVAFLVLDHQRIGLGGKLKPAI